MKRSFEQVHREVISGRDRSSGASLFRAALRAAEPIYSGIVSARNQMFDIGMRSSQRAARPVISVGNLTTGGTGKTPVVRWLAERLLAAGHHPAILLRGYKGGDEHFMLRQQLPDIIVEANPSRVAGAASVVQSHPDVTVFLLDDGFQHRMIRRDFDLVLIDESNPFGFNHVLPRGLLREPMAGLSRAHALLLTHVEQAEDFTIEPTLRKFNPTAPIYRSRHVHAGFVDRDGQIEPATALAGRKVMTFCGIGNPAGFDRQVAGSGAAHVGSHWFSDHHNYVAADLAMLRRRAAELGAELLITTEKDWVKLKAFDSTAEPPVWRAQLAIEFHPGDEMRLIAQITRAIESSPVAQPVSR
jgi:tetraacyldisaccharide 4'-kinase